MSVRIKMKQLKNKMKRTYYIILVSFLTLYSCKQQEDKTNKNENISDSPNFVLIMADDLGYGDLSCYGNTYINTPNIDRLASEGIKFIDFHSNGTVCSPSRAALLTGKYQQRTGVEGVITAANHRNVGLAIDEITIADELKMHGYSNGIFGKWHLGYSSKFNPVLQGFDKFVGFVSGNVDYLAHIDQEGYLDWWKDANIENEDGYTTDFITQYGIDFIKENKDRPFFLYLPHESPHYPYQRRIDDAHRKVGSKISTKVAKDSIPSIYKEMVEVLDEGIGQIMQTLKENNLDDNTIVIFCSDNGANSSGSNGVLRGFKAQVYEGGHRVPAIARYPKKFKAGTVCNEPIMLMDIMPTFLDFIGEKPSNKNNDGISFKDVLLSDKTLQKRDLYWSFGKRNAIRSGNWKLVSNIVEGQEIIELFDLTNDLSEKSNRAIERPELVRQLKQNLDNWQKEVRNGVVKVSN